LFIPARLIAQQFACYEEQHFEVINTFCLFYAGINKSVLVKLNSFLTDFSKVCETIHMWFFRLAI
jgi:hypothetical protein